MYKGFTIKRGAPEGADTKRLKVETYTAPCVDKFATLIQEIHAIVFDNV